MYLSFETTLSQKKHVLMPFLLARYSKRRRMSAAWNGF